MRYLTVEEVLEINAEVIGGGHALRDLGLLESAVARPQASAFGADAYPDLASKAAALLHSLVLNHAFVDGNKRTAVLSTLVFLDLNGYVVLRLATHQIELKDAIIFLHSKMHPKDAIDSHPSTQ
jgi:death-on-curing protein